MQNMFFHKKNHLIKKSIKNKAYPVYYRNRLESYKKKILEYSKKFHERVFRVLYILFGVFIFVQFLRGFGYFRGFSVLGFRAFIF